MTDIIKPISVALATCNGERYLAEQLDSIINQSYTPDEVIICDDASDDQTIVIIESYIEKLPIKLYRSAERIGVVKNFRRAISKCSCEWIACCDQDDVWFTDKLALTAKAMSSIDGEFPALVFTNLTVTDELLAVKFTSYWQMRNLNPRHETFYSLLFGNIVTGCTMLLNKAMKDEMQKMPDAVIMHDYWAATIAYAFGKYAIVDCPTLFYRQHGNNITTNDEVTLKSRIVNLFKYINSGFNGYLSSELSQASLFYDMYSKKIKPNQKLLLIKFLSLKNTKTWKRKLLASYMKWSKL